MIPGDFERRGLEVDVLGQTYVPASGLNAETQYLVGGARLIWKLGATPGSGGTGFEKDARLTYAVPNLLNSTTAVIDLFSGQLLESATYYPNGARETLRTERATGSEFSLEPLGFTGKEGDDEVGLVYFGERYLIPHIGRWASPDPLQIHGLSGGEFGNSYHYVGGNLLQARDPLGLNFEKVEDGHYRGSFTDSNGQEHTMDCRGSAVACLRQIKDWAFNRGLSQDWDDLQAALEQLVQFLSEIRDPVERQRTLNRALRTLRSGVKEAIEEAVLEGLADLGQMISVGVFGTGDNVIQGSYESARATIAIITSAIGGIAAGVLRTIKVARAAARAADATVDRARTAAALPSGGAGSPPAPGSAVPSRPGGATGATPPRATMVVGSDGTSVPVSQARMRDGFDRAGYPSRPATHTAEAGQIHTVDTPHGPVDVRTMEGSSHHPRRAVTTRAGTNDPVRVTGERFRNNEPKPVRRAGSHLEQDP